MADRSSSVKSIVGSWAPYLCDLFYDKTVREFSEELRVTRELPFDEVFGDFDYFKVFRQVSFDKLKGVYIKTYNNEPTQQLREMEEDLFKGFNICLTVQDGFEWLLEQGVMILPRYFTWGTPEVLHKKWGYFTTEVVREIVLNKHVPFCTSDPDIIRMIDNTNNSIPIIGQGPGCWEKFAEAIKEKGEIVEWNPWKCGKKYQY